MVGSLFVPGLEQLLLGSCGGRTLLLCCNTVAALFTPLIQAGKRAREACFLWAGPEPGSAGLEGTGQRLKLFFRFISM